MATVEMSSELRFERRGAGPGTRPFLTVMTRCYRRERMLARNVASLEAQTVADYEQVLLVDEVGRGLHLANMALAEPEPRGDYVLVLDDDDMLVDDEAIAALKEAAADLPDLIVFRAEHAHLGTLPRPTVWGKGPVLGHIGSCDFITRVDWWERHIDTFGAPKCGDFRFLESMWKEGPRVVWLDRVLAAVQRISGGQPE